MLKKNPNERITADEVVIHPWVTNKNNTSPLVNKKIKSLFIFYLIF